MKLAIIAACLLAAIAFVAWSTHPWEYNEADTEAAFDKIAQGGFDEGAARQLIKQYRVSDASFRLHFLAFGHVARLKNEKAFEGSGGEKWTILVKDIQDHGEMAAEDWFGPKKFQELRQSATALHTTK